MQGFRFPVDYNEIDLLVDLHAEADLGEGCVPAGEQFGLLEVKPSLHLKGFFVVPQGGIVMKSLRNLNDGRSCFFYSSQGCCTFPRTITRTKSFRRLQFRWWPD